MSWNSYESFFREVVGLQLETNSRAKSYADAQSSSFWWWPHRNFVMVCDRPEQIHLEQVSERGWGSHVLHKEDGPALRFRDGYGIYMWHGVAVPKSAIEDPSSITLEQIDSEENVEIKRSLIEIYGEVRFFHDKRIKIISMDMETCRKGAAPRVMIEDSDGNKCFIGTDGGTSRLYVIRGSKNCKTPRDIHEEVCGFDETRILNKS